MVSQEEGREKEGYHFADLLLGERGVNSTYHSAKLDTVDATTTIHIKMPGKGRPECSIYLCFICEKDTG